MITDREYWYWLLNTEHLTSIAIDKLLKKYESPKEIFMAKKIEELTEIQAAFLEESKSRFDVLRSDYEKLEDKKIKMLLRSDMDYPNQLKGIPQEPYGIFVKGELPPQKFPLVSIVGARKATQHGKWFAHKLAKEIAEYGIGIVSGMAEGIDGSSHLGALDANGKTIAVLGCGVDVCFPRAHEDLYNSILENGAIVSEYGPGVRGLSYHFPKRNRIISALSKATIVVEARERSGTLITVSCALSQGRDVMAVPGRPDDTASESCNRLLKEGAGCCTCAQDVANLIGCTPQAMKNISKEPMVTAGDSPGTSYIKEESKKILEVMSGEPVHLDRILDATGIEFGKLVTTLMELELKGLITSTSPGIYRRN